MILALLHLVAGFGQVPAESAIPSALRASDIPVSVQMSETHFLATSLVDEYQWLVFSSHEHGMVHVRGLAPFERTLLPIEAGGADGLSVELVMVGSSGRYLSTGALACEHIAGTIVFVQRNQLTATAWLSGHNGRSLTRATTLRSERSTRLESTPVAAVHVPVPLPGEHRRKQKARRVEKKKLPPF